MSVVALMTMRVLCDTNGCNNSQEFDVEANWNVAVSGWLTMLPDGLPFGWSQDVIRDDETTPWSLLRWKTWCPECTSKRVAGSTREATQLPAEQMDKQGGTDDEHRRY